MPLNLLQQFSASGSEPGEPERIHSGNVMTQGTRSTAHGSAAYDSSMRAGTSKSASMQQPAGRGSNMHAQSADTPVPTGVPNVADSRASAPASTPVPPTSPTPLVTGAGAAGQAVAVEAKVAMGVMADVANLYQSDVQASAGTVMKHAP